ncbi:HIRAN domain-containing protein [Devosia submarina]|uniref:HIRAN domain-containing protein n=1 Tax=Devosia submarina TaxID=1173082 RepID=UPI000D3CBC14|nr:HIRAN domain-containing protein [Devosia submarina]
MYRRAFVAGGVGALATVPLSAAANSSPAGGSSRKLMDSYVTSIDANAMADLMPGTPLTLRRDPQRRFEPAHAVAVLAGERHLGYLPGTTGKLVAPLLDSGLAKLHGSATRIRKGERPVIDLEIYIG